MFKPAQMTAPIRIPTPDVLNDAAQILRAGGLVAVPTETVYGLAADGTQGEAVARLYAAKGRPSFNPLIAHISGFPMAKRVGVLSDHAVQCADTFWPGPLSIVVPITDDTPVCALARAGLDTIALRHPDHPVPQALIGMLGRPIVAPSANLSGRISPVRAKDVAEELGDKVDLILDGGPSRVGLESSVVAFTGPRPTLLRPGGVAREDLEAALGVPLADSAGPDGAPASPGQLMRHYAPAARLRLNAHTAAPGEVLIGFGDIAGDTSLSATGRLDEAAANLFTRLREADALASAIAIAPIPNHGLGEAINDRLQRAARGRENPNGSR